MPAVTARDPRVVRAAALLREPGEHVCLDGPELIDAALAEGLELEYVLGDRPGAIPAAPDALRALGALGQPATVAAVAKRPAPGRPEDARLALCDVTDAGNVGTILRTVAALGGRSHRMGAFDGPTVALVGDTADPMTRRALRASAGASLRPGLTVRANLDELPRPLAAAVPHGGRPPTELAQVACVVLGSERDGLSAAAISACDELVTIPAPGFESLNVAAAAAILMWEIAGRS